MSRGTQTGKIMVVMLGLAGAGKSTFINAAAGREAVYVGDTLDTGTNKTQAVTISNPRRRTQHVILVDTRGFDDPHIKDSEIIIRLIDWLRGKKDEGIPLAGFIYLHDMTQARSVNAERIIRLFSRGVCKHFIPTSTKWQNVTRSIVREREAQWRNYWDGWQFLRFEDSHESAWKIIDQVLERYPDEVTSLYEELFKLQNCLRKEPNPEPTPQAKKGFWAKLFGKK